SRHRGVPSMGGSTMRKVIAGIGTLAVGVALTAGSALAQTQTYPMGISSPAYGPGSSGANSPAAAAASQPSAAATTSQSSRSATTSQPSRPTANSSTANSSFASAPSERSEIYQTYPRGISSPAYGP